MTLLDLISLTAKSIGVLAAGETLPADQANDIFLMFNNMLDTWSNEKLLVNAIVEEDFPLVCNQQLYTMGPGGNFNTTRPQQILNAALRISTDSCDPIDEPIEIINNDQWVAIPLKTTASTFPYRMYPEYAFPLVNLQFWPIPLATNTAVLWSWKSLSDVATLETTLTLPPGSLEALMYNLAPRIAPMYGKQIDPEIINQASQSKAALKRINHRPQYLRIDPAILPVSPVFNWRTGE